MKKLALATLLLCATHVTFAQKSTENESPKQFTHYLEKKLNNGVVNTETIKEFHQHARNFWRNNQINYTLHPEKYSNILPLLYKNKRKYKRNGKRDVNRYKSAINNFHYFDKRNSFAKDPVLFIGSSSIAGWETANSFPKLPIINRGLGGMAVPEIIHYYDTLIKKHSPSVLVIYSDIDVEMGKTPAVAVKAFDTLINKVSNDFPKTQIILLSMKPTLVDDFIGKDILKNKIATNKQLLAYSQKNKNIHFVDLSPPMFNKNGRLRSDIFLDDGMHLNALGYSLWNPILRKKINSLSK